MTANTSIPNSLLSLIPFFPLAGAGIAYLTGLLRREFSGWVATAASTLSFLVVLKLFFSLPDGAIFEHNLFEWIHVGELKIDFLFRFDALTAVMCLVVTGVGSLIHLYSISYMSEDEGQGRFFAYLNLFMFCMLLLVLGGNLVVLFVGWEGVGLCSYLLIGFWYKNISFASAGRKAFVVNRIGDAGFLLGMFFLVFFFGSLDLSELKTIIENHPSAKDLCGIVAFFLFVGATGKSAQIPLFVWLPDAMAGPTPVSALIHAATMVTAGVYLLARMFFLFSLTPEIMLLVCSIAVLTAFVAGTIALVQYDIKKVLAYSTVSQLGFMFMAASVGAYSIAVFHLVTHAFFKACLFLGAGSVIHGCHHEQDMRHMGGLWKKMPITCITYAVSTLAIAGIAPFAGYYSKHSIMTALEQNHISEFVGVTHIFVTLASLTAFITAFYMTRSFVLTFMGSYRGHAHPHESPWEMTYVLSALAILALLGGYLLSEHFSLEHYLSSVLPHGKPHAHETIVEAMAHSWIGFLGVGLALLFYTKASQIPKFIYKTSLGLGKLFSGKYFFDELYHFMFVRPLETFSNVLWKSVDQDFIDGAVNSTAALVDMSGETIRYAHTGQLRHYALFMLAATIFIILFYILVI